MTIISSSSVIISSNGGSNIDNIGKKYLLLLLYTPIFICYHPIYIYIYIRLFFMIRNDQVVGG
jgi:hypothetical protein